MNPFRFAMRRPMTAFMLVVALLGGVVYGLYHERVDIPQMHSRQVYAFLDHVSARVNQVKGPIVRRVNAYLGGGEHSEEHHEAHHKIIVTTPKSEDVTLSQQYVCQIHSQNHINVRSLDDGYLEQIAIKEGQVVKKGDLLFKILPIQYQARYSAEKAEADLAQLELNYTQQLANKNVVSQNEVLLLKAKLARAQAKAQQAQAELNFTNVVAPFDGIVDRLHEQVGSLIKKEDILTTLSDNSLMWVYFNVPEARYLEYMSTLGKDKEQQKVELVLANGETFNQPGKISTIEAKFNNETGNIPFRADFPNPNGLLRHGQTGTVMIHRIVHNAMVIPQRATFEILDKRYAYVVGDDHVVHQQEVEIQNELDDLFVLKKGLDVKDKIVLEGVRQVHDGEKVEFDFEQPELVMKNLKNRAE